MDISLTNRSTPSEHARRFIIFVRRYISRTLNPVGWRKLSNNTIVIIMSKKFSLKKFQKDRDKSYQASKNGDYKLIEHNEGRSEIIEIISNLQDMLKPVVCEQLSIGCKLPYWKRMFDKCNECYYKK